MAHIKIASDLRNLHYADPSAKRLTRSVLKLRVRTQQNANTALLKLPQEIKDRIWKFALGGNLLEIIDTYRSRAVSPGKAADTKLFHVTGRPSKEMDNIETLLAVKGRQPGRIIVTCGHDDLCDRWSGGAYIIMPKYNISLLYTCKQVYAEAWSVPYTSNCFSFDSSITLTAWISRFQLAQAEGQHPCFAALQHIAMGHSKGFRFKSLFQGQSFAEVFPGLKTVTLWGQDLFQPLNHKLEQSEELFLKFLFAKGTSFDVRFFDKDGKAQSKVCVAQGRGED